MTVFRVKKPHSTEEMQAASVQMSEWLCGWYKPGKSWFDAADSAEPSLPTPEKKTRTEVLELQEVSESGIFSSEGTMGFCYKTPLNISGVIMMTFWIDKM